MSDSSCKKIPPSGVRSSLTGSNSDWSGSGRWLVFNEHVSGVLLGSEVRSGAQASSVDKGAAGGLSDGNRINQITGVQSIYGDRRDCRAVHTVQAVGGVHGLDAFTLS